MAHGPGVVEDAARRERRIMVRAMSVEWKPDLSIEHVRKIGVPWNVLAQEAHDRGSYILIINLKEIAECRSGDWEISNSGKDIIPPLGP